MHDLVVIGGGPAGIEAALAARARGLDVVLVDGRERLRRAFLESALCSELAERPARGDAAIFARAIRRAGELAAGGLDHVDTQLARRGVSRLPGRARLTGEPGVVSVVPHAGPEETLRARHVLLATGARSVVPQEGPPEDLPDARARLSDLAAPPASALVVGGGRAGVELAGLLAAAGARVTLVERAPRLLPDADADVSAASRRALESAGVVVRVELIARDVRAGRVTGSADGAASSQTLEAESVLLAGASEPDLSALAGSLRSAIQVPLPAQEYRTALPWLFVAGRASGRRVGPEAARREGRAAVAAISGAREHVPHEAVPRFVVGLGGGGWVGCTEAAAVAAGHALRVGRARLPGHAALPPGFVKVVADAGSGRLLGVHVAGAFGHEAVMLAAALIELGAGRQDLAAMSFPASSPAESLAEAAASAVAP